MEKLDMDEAIHSINDAIIQDLERKLAWYSKRYGPYIEKRGFKNWRNLFAKPNNYEWTILFMLLMAGFIAWAYQVDTVQCRETLENIEVICIDYCSSEFDIEQANTGLNERRQNLTDFRDIIIKADDFKSSNGSN